MAQSLDFKAIRETPLAALAGTLGIPLTEVKSEKYGVQLVGACPISQLANPTAFKVTPSLNRWHCFCSECKKQDKAGGDCIELVRRLNRLSDTREAAALVLKLTGAGKPPDNAPDRADAAQGRKPDGFDPLKYLEKLDPSHEALKELDIMPETLVTFKAGYASQGLNRGRMAVAWCDVTGTVKFFVGISLDGSVPQYLLPKGQETPYWYGTHVVEPDQELRIVPDIVGVMRAHENGGENVICPMRPIDGDSLQCLRSLVMSKKLTVEF